MSRNTDEEGRHNRVTDTLDDIVLNATRALQEILNEFDQSSNHIQEISSSDRESIRLRTERDFANIQMDHLKNEVTPLTGPAHTPTIVQNTTLEMTSDQLRARILQLEQEAREKDMNILQLRESHNNSRNENEKLKKMLNKLSEKVVLFYEGVEVKQLELPKLGENNQEGVHVQKYINFTLHNARELYSLVWEDKEKESSI